MFGEMFKKEEYTKEKFDEAKKDADSAQKEVYQREHPEGYIPGPGFYDVEETRRFNDLLKQKEDEAHKRVEKLYGQSEKEARVMNEEYDRLLARATDEVFALAVFEGEKLGIHHEENPRKNNSYDRKKFDGAMEDVKELEKTPIADEEVKGIWKLLRIIPTDSEMYQHHLANAHKEVQELYGKGETEARKLNDEYDRLFTRAKESVQAVTDFEIEKLGMHQEK